MVLLALVELSVEDELFGSIYGSESVLFELSWSIVELVGVSMISEDDELSDG